MAGVAVELWAVQLLGVMKAVTEVTSAVTVAAGQCHEPQRRFRIDG